MIRGFVLQKRQIVLSLLGWLVVWAFWLSTTHRFHPSFALALIVTTSLICAFAAAAYCNHLILVPRFWALNRPWQYLTSLVATMATFTAFALALIQGSYFLAVGPDSDSYGLYKHYAIDLFGMIVHVASAAFIAWLNRSFVWIPDRTTVSAEQCDPPKLPVGRKFES